MKRRNEDIILGIVVGDGCLYGRFNKPGANAMLDVAHACRYKEYLIWKADVLKEAGFPVVIKYKPAGRGGNFAKFRFVTPAHRYWTELMAQFYAFRKTRGKKRKRLTRKLLDRFTIRTFAVWFLDDGYSNADRNYIQLGVYGFTVDEATLVADRIEQIFGVRMKVYQRKGCPFLVLYKDADVFLRRIYPYVQHIQCMQYKFSSICHA